jgi:formylglycine-generating enzyme required for sulfatase activity
MYGETWHYQLWRRDTPSGFGTSNFTYELSATFQPPAPIPNMVPIASGSFRMGSAGLAGSLRNGSVQRQPVHSTTISYDFLMSETEITQGEY